MDKEQSRDEYVASLRDLDRETRARLLWSGGLAEHYDEFVSEDAAGDDLYSALIAGELRARRCDEFAEMECCPACGRPTPVCASAVEHEGRWEPAVPQKALDPWHSVKQRLPPIAPPEAPGSSTGIERGRATRSPRCARTSESISKKGALNLLAAVEFANQEGYLLNAFVTVSWGLLGIPDEEAQVAFRALCQRMNKWLNAHGEVPWLSVFVWERGQRLGLHTHLLLHLPPHLGDQFRSWLRKSAGRLASASHVGRQHVDVQVTGLHRLRDQNARLRYILKGLGPEVQVRSVDGESLPLSKLAGVKLRRGGCVPGKRVGTSEEIGRESRRRAGFAAMIERGARGPADFLVTAPYREGRRLMRERARAAAAEAILAAVIALQGV